jgi:type II secretory pathway pseudopilin PulG
MSRAYSAIELLVGVTLALLLCGVGMPALLSARDDIRADGAAHFLVSQFHQARMEALRRNAQVAVRFESDSDDYLLAYYVDGNANGVRATDITSGADPLLRPRERLGQRFPSVRFGFEEGVPDLDNIPSAENPDPVRFGRSRMLSFSPTGTSSSGTVYLHGRGHRQLAVRVMGGTGRIRSLLFNFGAARWDSR